MCLEVCRLWSKTKFHCSQWSLSKEVISSFMVSKFSLIWRIRYDDQSWTSYLKSVCRLDCTDTGLRRTWFILITSKACKTVQYKALIGAKHRSEINTWHEKLVILNRAVMIYTICNRAKEYLAPRLAPCDEYFFDHWRILKGLMYLSVSLFIPHEHDCMIISVIIKPHK